MTDQTVRTGTEGLLPDELRDAWGVLDLEERLDGLKLLSPGEGEAFFESLPSMEQLELLRAVPPAERRLWVRALAPDDTADLIQHADDSERAEFLGVLDDTTRREVTALLAYSEDDAGGLMSPRYARVRPDMSVDEAILYLRKQAALQLETIYYGYVLDRNQQLLGVVSFRDLFRARGQALIQDIMKRDVVSVPETMDQEAVGRVFAEHDLIALPVLDEAGRMKGIVTADDIVDVVQEEATEDIQKLGGTAALEAPYLDVGVLDMVKKRAIWLVVLFFGEMFTITAMSRYEHSIDQIAFLASFVPLIISSGGNSGSQASTLVIRAMALGEVRLRDWWRVMRRELLTGLSLGAILGAIGLLRIAFAPGGEESYAGFAGEFGLTVAVSLVGVVLWGAFVGSMLPILLRRAGLDPASASAPLVATLCDVTGLLIYFNAANYFLARALA